MRYLILLLLSLKVTTAIASFPRCPSYDRKDWQHWIDEDHDCPNARHEVLIAESTSPLGFKTSKGCRVVYGN